MLSTNRYLRPVDIERAQPVLYPWGRPSKIWTKGFTLSWDTMNRFNPVSATSVDIYLPEITTTDIGRVCVLSILRDGTTAFKTICAPDQLIWLSGSSAAAARTQTNSSDRVRFYVYTAVSESRWVQSSD